MYAHATINAFRSRRSEGPPRWARRSCERSAIARRAYREVVINLAARKGNTDHGRCSRTGSGEQTAGLEVREAWAEDAIYGELFHIAKAVEEFRREIDLQTLQNLIDPEHNMDRGDWVSFWQDRGFSGDSEPSGV